jgi:hypothetical protein
MEQKYRCKHAWAWPYQVLAPTPVKYRCKHAWAWSYDSGGLLIPTIICFSSVFAPYSFHICFQKYLFSYLFPVFSYSFMLLHKNMKTNMGPLSSVRFRSVFIPRHGHGHMKSLRWRLQIAASPWTSRSRSRIIDNNWWLICVIQVLQPHLLQPVSPHSWPQSYNLQGSI